MHPQQPPGAYQLPRQPKGMVSPVYDDRPAHSSPRNAPRSRRGWFWAFAAWHLLVPLWLMGAGGSQTDLETFSILGAAAAVDVMIVAGAWVWQHTGSRP
jgi:hypothetical protein